MALIAGGDIHEVSISNPDVGTVFYSPMSGESNEINFGGIQSEDNKAVTASGTLVNSFKRVPGMTEIVVASNESGNEEYQKTVLIAASTKESIMTIAMVTGVVYKASGVVQGELKLDVYKSTFTLPFVSGLGFKQQ